MITRFKAADSSGRGGFDKTIPDDSEIALKAGLC